MIMSTLMLASASGMKIAAATPGLSATSRKVICASSREKAMPVTTSCSMISSSSQMSVPSLGRAGSSNDERTWSLTLLTIATSTERTCSTLAPSEAISSISSNDTLSRRRAFGTMRRSDLSRCHPPVLHHPGFQPFTDQA